MKIALIVPPVTLEERYNKAIARATGSLPPLGIVSIGTMLTLAGHDVTVLDGSISSYDEIMGTLARLMPPVVGISASTPLWNKVRTVSRALKEKWPRVNIIVGGPHASIVREKALREVPDIDAVAWGEGDFSMREYVEHLQKPGSSQPIDGIAYRCPDGSIVAGRDRKPIEDLDALPIPDRTLIPIRRYTGALDQYRKVPLTNMITSRGCPFRCKFCVPDLLGKGVRYRSADKVVEEMELLHREFGINDIAFWDDTFTANAKRVFEICDRIIARKLDISWSAQARADCVSPEMLRAMARAGCWKLFYGVESLVQKNLDTLRKGETVEQICRAVNWTKESGIEVEASFIFGIPGETFREGLETIRRAREMDPDYAKFFYLALWNDAFMKEAGRYGTVLTEDAERMTGNVMMFVPYSMTRQELETLYYTAYRTFYFRPGMLLQRIRKLTNPVELRKSIVGFFVLCSFFREELRCRSHRQHPS